MGEGDEENGERGEESIGEGGGEWRQERKRDEESGDREEESAWRRRRMRSRVEEKEG